MVVGMIAPSKNSSSEIDKSSLKPSPNNHLENCSYYFLGTSLENRYANKRTVFYLAYQLSLIKI